MAAIEPSEEHIDMLMSVYGADRNTAWQYLKAKQNNVEQAANALMDGEDITQQLSAGAWDESHWGADRDGGMESIDSNLRPLTTTAPPSRAPSRNSMHPSTKQDEDEQLAEAIRMSQMTTLEKPRGPVDIQMPDFDLYEQEVGRVSGDGKEVKFGPATRDKHYEAARWALVPTSQAASEVIPDVDVEHRKNVPGEPRFLKYQPEADYLPNLLTICHAIAGAREAMLQRKNVRSSYGEDAEWWKGHPISMPRIVHVDSGELVNEETENFRTLIMDVQRLMGALDQSERSYVSIKAMLHNSNLQTKRPGEIATDSIVQTFLEHWSAAVADSMGMGAELFKTSLRSADEEAIHLLDLTVGVPENEKIDLNEVLDARFWNAGANGTDVDRIEDLPAHVLVMRLRNTSREAKQLRVDIPTDFSMDKYLSEFEHVSGPIRQELGRSRARIKKLSDLEKRLTTWRHPKKDKIIDPRALLKHTHGALTGRHDVDEDKDALPNGVAVDGDGSIPTHHDDVTQKLEKVIASIDDKLTLLAAEKEKARAAMAQLSRDPVPLEQSRTRYTLRGVATKPNITYVLTTKEDEDEDQVMLLDNEDDTTPEGMQWWRIEYNVDASGTGAKIMKTKTPGYDVIRAVELEHHSALLVYGSNVVNDIIHYDPTLPPSLQEFVEKDNEHFRAELQDAVSNVPPPAYQFGHTDAYQDVPRVSVEAAEAEPRDSLDSIRVEGGDSDSDQPEYNDFATMDSHHSFGLPPPIKQGQYVATEDAGPTAEIHLDELMEEAGEGQEVEMMEKRGQALIPGLNSAAGSGMDDVRGEQDDGVGGSMSHVEDLKGM
ncbi:hypothetical protein BAUCODRAFT_121820 [Baudoinia panamericana UAMH 10762]|uniref:UBA domain-containing protein n=1 Tax=Baudoinia panamericana (strain UAMH 10762) TaxID=717646 RepID=M2LSB1_BAUPA|nr:uncharacterized protein BAUCODRAFT_121820 [Baudoinia panamericana UAMH 10762]EMC97362.1 hypothetical protein BAUCODRAFT_121820 [Baudoinia panamericana UAMH 10762]